MSYAPILENSKLQQSTRTHFDTQGSILSESSHTRNPSQGFLIKQSIFNSNLPYSQLYQPQSKIPEYASFGKSHFIEEQRTPPKKPTTLIQQEINTVVKPGYQNNISKAHLLQGKHTEEVESVFRYCFVCENMVLEYNIDAHQSSCAGFQQVCEKTKEELIQLANEKIQKIQKKMKEIIDDDKMPDITRHNIVENAQIVLSQSSTTNRNFEKAYQQMNKIHESKELKLMEQAYKLKWFLKIREQMRNRFNL